MMKRYRHFVAIAIVLVAAILMLGVEQPTYPSLEAIKTARGKCESIGDTLFVNPRGARMYCENASGRIEYEFDKEER